MRNKNVIPQLMRIIFSIRIVPYISKGIEDASYLQYNRLSFLSKLYQMQFKKQKISTFLGKEN